jgi:hypothetical protein
MSYDLWVDEVIQNPAPQWTTPGFVCSLLTLELTFDLMKFELKIGYGNECQLEDAQSKYLITGVNSLLAFSNEFFRSLQLRIVNGPSLAWELWMCLIHLSVWGWLIMLSRRSSTNSKSFLERNGYHSSSSGGPIGSKLPLKDALNSSGLKILVPLLLWG